ncbi:hypothetical protein BH11MYX1_BH11MYX1_12650 [soil metagenome]
MSNFRKRSIFGVLVVVFGALLFLVSSAFVVDRFSGHGFAKILAAIVGGLAFPVLPVAWHIWGERRRRARLAEAKKPSRSQLTARDRFWFRFIGVAVVIVGPMVAMQKFGVVRAAIKHGLWFLPESKPGLGMIGGGERRALDRINPLIQRVPGGATAVIVYTPDDKGEALVAFDGRNIMAVSQGDLGRDPAAALESVNRLFAAQHVVLTDSLAMVFNRDLALAASKGWEAKVEPAPNAMPAALRRELERAPGDSLWSAARVPDRDSKDVRAEAAWVTRRGTEYVIEARIEAIDVGHAYGLVQQLRQLDTEAKRISLPAECVAGVARLSPTLELAQYGAIVTLRATADHDFIRDVERCAN